MIATIEVTEDDIARGVPRSACGCPVALAVRRAVGGLAAWDEVAVRACGVLLSAAGRLQGASRPLPPVAREFIARFDAKKPVGPIRFPLFFFDDHPAVRGPTP